MADGSHDGEKLRKLCGLLIGSGKPLGLTEIASACGVAEDEVGPLIAAAKERLASVGLCLLAADKGRWFVSLDVSTKAAVGKLNGDAPGRKQISPEAAETLALISEKGPLTLRQMGRIRGANPRNALETLLELDLVQRAGRARGRGGAWLYRASIHPAPDSSPSYRETSLSNGT